VQIGLGVKTSAVQKDFVEGAAKITNNELDVQIEGPGFFPVQLPDGQIGYTRDGAFKKDATGRIVDKNGNSLQPQITLPPNSSGALTIEPNGSVSVVLPGQTASQVIGQIELVNFINPAGLRSVGKNVFMPTPASGLPVQGAPGTGGLGSLSQKQLEASNVNIVEEMVNMITAQRAYETNSKVIQASDQMLQSVNQLR
jgi:flagellar basal-body rod protein FlgG